MRPLYEIKRDYLNAFLQVRKALKSAEHASTDAERDAYRVVTNVYTKRFRHFLDEAMQSYPNEYQRELIVSEAPTTADQTGE